MGKTEGKLFDIANGRLNPALLGLLLLLLFSGKLLLILAVVTAAFVLLFDDDRDPLSALFDSSLLALVVLPDKCRLAMLVMGR